MSRKIPSRLGKVTHDTSSHRSLQAFKMSAVDLQNEPVGEEVSASNSGFTNMIPNGSELPSPESISVEGDSKQLASSDTEDHYDQGGSAYRRSRRSRQSQTVQYAVAPPPSGYVPRTAIRDEPQVYGRGFGTLPQTQADWATAYYGRGGPVPRNIYEGYPLAFDNVKMGGNEMDRLADLLKEHDKMKVENSNGDIDSLLILTGLFSAIVAAFTIESYKNLQPDPMLASSTLLAQLVLHFNGTSGLQDAGYTFAPLPSSAASMDVVVNSLWFVSLICSVITASVGIFVKQWLRDYINIACSSSEEWVRIRQIRHESIHQWRVFELSTFLPLLLQFALLLFLIGLALFLLSINQVVGWIVTTGVIFYVSGLVFIVVIPMISAGCPYQIAFLRQTAEYIRGSFIRFFYGSHWRQRLGYENPFYRFPGDERGARREQKLDVEAVIGADTSLMDNTALEITLQPCLSSFGLKSTLFFAREMMANRLDRPISHLREISPDDYASLPRQVLDVLLNILCSCTENLFSNDTTVLAIPDMGRFQNVTEALWGFYILLDHLYRTDRRYHMSNWRRAMNRLDTLPMLCLEPSIPETVPEDIKLQLTSFGSDEFVKMMVECPNAKLENNLPLSTTAVKNLLQAATRFVNSKVNSDAGGLVVISLTRVIFHTLAYNDNPTDFHSFSSELKLFNDSIFAVIHQPRQYHTSFHDDGRDILAEEVSSAVHNAGFLNSKAQEEFSLVSREVIESLKALDLRESNDPTTPLPRRAPY
ncbi:hypothetical protein QCA50_011311 [Cerrena zonata]|uniref:DUF6535 domain-containing protein n=1 Tax=Cerrena zonata TaxID=2478898 RepID=A0AAW0FV45_9APHY